MQPQPRSTLLNSNSRPNTQHPVTYPPRGVIPDRQLLNHPGPSSSNPPSFRRPITIVTTEANTRAIPPSLTSAPPQMSLSFPHSAPAVSPLSRTQIQHRHSYPPSMDARHPHGPPVRVGGSVTNARPSAPAGTNTPSNQPPNPHTSTQSVSIPAHPDTHRPPTAPLPAPPEIASLLHHSVDLEAIQRKMEGSLSQVGVNLGAIWRHIVEVTTLESAKHRSDTLRWKERCLHFEEMYKNCKQKLDNMNHDNIILATQINRLQAELTRVRGQGRPVGPSPQVMRDQDAYAGQGQDHVTHERARTNSSLHPNPAPAAEELPPPPSNIQEISTTSLRKNLVIELPNDGSDAEIEPPQPERLDRNEPSSALCVTEEQHPVPCPTNTVRLLMPPEHSTGTPPTAPPSAPPTAPPVTSSHGSSPEVPTRVTTSPKSSRVTTPLATLSISGFLSSTPSSAIRTVTPVKPRSNVNNSTLTMTPISGTLSTTVVSPVQATKPAAISFVDEPEEELEEGEVSPVASPVNGKAVGHTQLPVRAEPTKNAPPHSESVPPLSLYFKPNQPVPLIPKKIPKKRPFETGDEGPIKRPRPVLPPSTTNLPQRQTGMASRSTTVASSRPGTVERSYNQRPQGMPKREPKSPVLPPNTSSRSKSTETVVSLVKSPYEDTAVTASDPPSGYVSSQKEELKSLITKELRRQDEFIYCYPCIRENEKNPSKFVTRFNSQQSTGPHVLYHFESQHTEWWEKVQADASHPTSA